MTFQTISEWSPVRASFLDLQAALQELVKVVSEVAGSGVSWAEDYSWLNGWDLQRLARMWNQTTALM